MKTAKPSTALLTIAAGAAVSVAAAAPLHFVDVTSSRVVQTVAEVGNNEKSVELGDFDNDGDLDAVIGVALSDFGAKRNKLYRNDNGVMQEVTGTAIPSFVSTQRVTRVAFLKDYDEDGWADIYVINDANSNTDQLFLNQHPGGVFQSFTEVTGHLPNGGLLGAACSGVSVDLNNDGHIDVFSANYPNSPQDKLIFGDGAGFFTDVTNTHMISDSSYDIEADAADFNNDGQLDLIITNDGSATNYILWNNNQNAGSGPGDFRYTGSTSNFAGGTGENAMEPGDFDGDGLIDFYWGNFSGNVDRVFKNMGIGSNGKATFQQLTSLNLPPSVSQHTVRKIVPGDLNADGRVDAIVMKESAGDNRPSVLRNTTVNGVISFVDWTEASAFPSGNSLEGWHGAIFDSNSDGDQDFFLGAFVGDHLFENELAPTFDASSLVGGVVPGVFDGSSAVVNRAKGDPTSFVIENVNAGGFVSAIVTGASDLTLDVLDAGGNVIGSSNRGGAGVEEALQVNNLSAGSITVRVSGENQADVNADTVVNGADLAILLIAFGTDGAVTGTDFNNDGIVDGADLATLLINWGTAGVGNFTLELLARSS